MDQFLHPHNHTRNDTDTNDEPDAIYVAITFLDTFFNYGQGIIVFAFFGLESKFVYQPLLKWVNTVQNLYQEPINIDDDPRLYHWTLKVIEKIFRALPKAERKRQDVQTCTTNM